MKILTFAMLLFGIGWFVMPDVHAQNSSGIEVIPAFLEVPMEASQSSAKVEITYINHTDHPVVLDMSSIDFKQSGDRGQISFLGQSSGAYSYSLSSFLSFEANQISLEPGEKKPFKVTVENRQDLSPGGHYAAVVAKASSDPADSRLTPVSPSLSTLLLVKKMGGELFNLSLVRADWPGSWFAFGYPTAFEVLFQNEGNVHLTPYGVVEVKDFLGRQVAKGALNNNSLIVFPEARRYIGAVMHATDWTLPISINSVTIMGQDSLKKTEYTYVNTYIYVNPYFAGGIAFFGIIGGIALVRRSRGHAKK